ncbi:MAG: hypothetical protein ABI895_18650 [Deltaproteobacteria bacterium]
MDACSSNARICRDVVATSNLVDDDQYQKVSTSALGDACELRRRAGAALDDDLALLELARCVLGGRALKAERATRSC